MNASPLETQFLRNHRNDWAFSLIEVTMAMAILTFAITGIIGLFLAALQAQREAVHDSEASSVASKILCIRRFTPSDQPTDVLPALTANTRVGLEETEVYVDAHGRLTTKLESASYRLFFDIRKEEALPDLFWVELELIAPPVPGKMMRPNAHHRFLINSALRFHLAKKVSQSS